jgi:predicted metal-dependent phosphoesterase TrpH
MASTVDLHIHTRASDGSDSPLELLRELRAAGIRTFSVTDHDTIDGVLELEGQIPADMVFLRGVEFSCICPAGKCHILGYGYDPAHPALHDAIREGQRLRREKMQRRVQRLRTEFGIALTEEELSWLYSRKSPGKPHLAGILVDRGLAPDKNEAIRRYIRDVPGRDRIDASTAIGAIAAAGGISVWAHPLGGEGEKRLTPEELEKLLAVLRDSGIRGMECWYSRYSMEEVRFLEGRARALGLTVTGGSDYHGTSKKNLSLGQLNTDGVAWEPGSLAGLGMK